MHFESHTSSKSLRYFISSGREAPDQFINEQNLLYGAWKFGWQQTYAELNRPLEPEAAEFLRQSIVTGIFDLHDRVVACHAYSFFNLDEKAHRDHSYFRTVPESAITELRERNIRKIMTMEYLYVSPEWRKSQSGVSLSDVLGLLALKNLLNSTADSCISITRNNRKVNEVAKRLGGTCLTSNLELHGVSVDIMLFSRDSDPIGVSGIEKQYAEELWNVRVDARPLINSLPQAQVANQMPYLMAPPTQALKARPEEIPN